jgi:hypothetical protein
MGQAMGLAEQAAHRELAALTDGPWSPCWYWRDELEAMQAAARYMHTRGGTAHLGNQAHYRPTNRWVDHPTEEAGRAWTYQPPPEGSTR